jgi:nucleoside-diphosphate-sugar epimerase
MPRFRSRYIFARITTDLAFLNETISTSTSLPAHISQHSPQHSMASPSEQTLLVTGANGFVAAHVIDQALYRGYNVRGTVRSESSANKVRDLFAEYGSRFSLSIVGDFTNKDALKPAFAGTAKPITGVISVAAPFTLKVEDNSRDLLDPAIQSAIAVLEATKLFGPSVRRVVSTSSFGAVLDLSQGYRPGYTYTEEDWNPTGYDTAAAADSATAYAASKALSEQAMWDWVKREQPAFSLATIAPTWVFGPHVGGIANLQRLNESSAALWGLLNAKAIPPTDFAGFVDVRLVAAAHLNAFEKPAAGGHRFLLSEHFDYQSAVDVLREELPELRSRIPVGKPGAGKLEEVYVVNGHKAESILGIEYIPLKKTMKDSFLELLEAERKVSA